jgi:hypothetical protein
VRRRVLLGALAAVGLLVHAWFVLGARALDTDRALVLLMARRFAEGHFSLYFWAQNYMAALEPLLLTPLAALGWATPLAAGVVATALTATMTVLSVVLARRVGGLAWVVLLLWAVPPAVVVHHHVSLYGARLVASLLVFAAFVWAVGAESRRAWVGIGALAGLAYLGDHLMLPWVAGIAWLALARGRLGALALGALPVVALDTVAAMATPAFHLSGPNEPGSWLGNVPLLLGVVLPQLFGLLLGRGPGPLFEPAGSVVPEGWAWTLFAIPGALALAGVAWTLTRSRTAIFGGDDRRAGVLRALLLVCALQLGLFLLVGGGGERWSVRYLVPLWPAVSVLVSVAVARWAPRLRPAAILLVLPAVYTLAVDRGWPPRGDDGAAAVSEADAVAAALGDAGAEAVWANYWDAYRLALLVGDSRPWVPLTIIERRPDWLATARAARPVAYLLREGDEEMMSGVREGGRAHGIDLLSTRRVGRFRLVLAERTIPGLVSMHDAPSRGWQMLAALAAGLLLPGVLLAVGVLGRYVARRSDSP